MWNLMPDTHFNELSAHGGQIYALVPTKFNMDENGKIML